MEQGWQGFRVADALGSGEPEKSKRVRTGGEEPWIKKRKLPDSSSSVLPASLSMSCMPSISKREASRVEGVPCGGRKL